MNRIQRFLCVCILALATILRVWQLGAVPGSPDWDEASLGYTAYSILQTGRDEYGNFLPLSIRSFDDYKPPLYVYLTVPSVYMFGLTIEAVRLPSVLFGILAVFGIYLLVGQWVIIAKKYTLFGWPLSWTQALPLVASGMLAISPWHIQFSRVAFEANIGVTLVIWATYFFLRGLSAPWARIVGATLFALSLYAYHTQRVFVPLYVLLLFVLHREAMFGKRTRATILSLVVGILILAPLISTTFDANAVKRLQGTSAFRQQTELLSTTIKKLEYDRANNWWLGEIYDNRRIEYARIVARGYLSHFSPSWLFLKGDQERHHAPNMGLLYIWELPVIAIGIFLLIRQGGAIGWMMLGWYLLTPLASAPTAEVPHAVRTLVGVPMYSLFSAIGLVAMYGWCMRHLSRLKWLGIGIMSIIVLVSCAYYFHMYFAHTNLAYSKYWQYGYRQAVEYVDGHKNEYKKIVVSTKLEQPYIFFLFYTKFDPALYQSLPKTANHSFGMYEFRPIVWEEEEKNSDILYVGTPDEIPIQSLVDIVYPGGSPAMVITTGK